MAQRIYSRAFLKKLVPPNVKKHFRELEAQVWSDINVHQEGIVLRKNKHTGHRKVKQSGKEYMLFTKELLRDIISSCSDGISERYMRVPINESLIKSVSHSLTVEGNDHEMVLITRANSPDFSEISNRNTLASEVLGFMVLYTGECKMNPTIPALQIICSSGTDKKVANYLMYLYVKGLKKRGFEKGLLEVAGGYANTSAMCLYNKYGFREDSLLDTQDCFYQSYLGRTLAMSVDLNAMSYAGLDDVVVNGGVVQLTNGIVGEPMCAKTGDIGLNKPGQKGYIDMRTKNREYLTKLFRYKNVTNDALIQELVDIHDVNGDLLQGDDQDAHYMKKELIEKGKKLAETEKTTLEEYSKKNRSPGSESSKLIKSIKSSRSNSNSVSADAKKALRNKIDFVYEDDSTKVIKDTIKKLKTQSHKLSPTEKKLVNVLKEKISNRRVGAKRTRASGTKRLRRSKRIKSSRTKSKHMGGSNGRRRRTKRRLRRTKRRLRRTRRK